MEWKQALRAQLRADGHRLTPITRTSLRPKGAHLHELRNSYEANCVYCSLVVRVQTFPGSKAEVKLSPPHMRLCTRYERVQAQKLRYQRSFVQAGEAGVESFFSTGKAASDEPAL